jgi:hypothetical protein
MMWALLSITRSGNQGSGFGIIESGVHDGYLSADGSLLLPVLSDALWKAMGVLTHSFQCD